MQIEAIVRMNGLYTVRAFETIKNGDEPEQMISYTASQIYNQQTKQVSLQFTSTEYLKPIPEDIKKALTEVLNFASKEF